MMASYCEIRAKRAEDQSQEKDGKVVEREFVVYLVRVPCAGVVIQVKRMSTYVKERENKKSGVYK